MINRKRENVYCVNFLPAYNIILKYFIDNHKFIRALLLSRLEKTTAFRRTGFSRHHVGPINSPLSHHSAIVLRDSRRALNWSPIMPRDASFSVDVVHGNDPCARRRHSSGCLYFATHTSIYYPK